MQPLTRPTLQPLPCRGDCPDTNKTTTAPQIRIPTWLHQTERCLRQSGRFSPVFGGKSNEDQFFLETTAIGSASWLENFSMTERHTCDGCQEEGGFGGGGGSDDLWTHSWRREAFVRLFLVSGDQEGRCGLWGLQTFPRGLDVLLPCPKVIAAPGASAEAQAGA